MWEKQQLFLQFAKIREMGYSGRMTSLLTGNKQAALALRKDDLYETPEVAIDALLRAIRLPHFIWEPACGPGSIVRSLRAFGHNVVATDLVDYGCPSSQSGIDFLMERKAPPLVQAIVTNPPFKLAGEFVERGLELCPRVIMLLRLAFLESKRRTSILDGGHLASVLVFKNRLPMMHRGGWDGNKSGSAMAFAWFLWSRDHKGPTTLQRISWERKNVSTLPLLQT